MAFAGMMALQINAVVAKETVDIYAMSLEELSKVKITSASLSDISLLKTPASVTHISQDDIAQSGARGIDELLRMYVPGLQLMRKVNGTALGIRGIISDRNDKFIILVNGRIMNEHSVLGGISERFISTLGDIESINVVRGPGSVIHGPGAIAGVIDISTFTPETAADGSWIKARYGIIDEFASVEYRTTHRYEDDSALFAYFGVDNYRGADNNDAPHIFSHDFDSSFGPVSAGHPLDADVPPNGESYRDQPRYKAHLQYNKEDLALWLRYTRGGEWLNASSTHWLASKPTSAVAHRGLGYQQVTVMSDYNHEINETLSLNFKLSYDMYDSERENGSAEPQHRSYREDEYFTRILTTWKPNDHHTLSYGIDFSHEIFGIDSPGFPGAPAFVRPTIPVGTPSWHSDTLSFLVEYQYRLNDKVTLHSGWRGDKNSDLDLLNSSRLAMVYTPTDHESIKLIYNHSVRIPVEESRRASELGHSEYGEAEQIDFYELRWERLLRQNNWLALSTYYGDHDVTGANKISGSTDVLGISTYYGIEGELTWQFTNAKLSLAHNYTKLMAFDLTESSITRTHVSANAYGYGDDFANWSNHQTTANLKYDLSQKATANMAVTAMWGFPGAKDYAKYNADVLDNHLGLPISNGYNRAFEESIFLNLGLEYQLNVQAMIRFDAFNVMGWFDKDYNKENIFLRTGYYQSDAAAIALTFQYEF